MGKVAWPVKPGKMLVPDMWAGRGRYRNLTRAALKRLAAAGGSLRNGKPEHYICAARGCHNLVSKEGARCGLHKKEAVSC